MSKHIVDDDFLYKHMRKAEIKMLDSLPKEEELSHKFSKDFEKKMDKLIKEQKRTPFMRSFVIYGKRVAAIFLIIVSVSFATTMSVEAYRVRFFEVITEVWEEFTSIVFKSEEGINDGNLLPTNPQYIPEGFSIFYEDVDDYMNMIIYKNEANIEIFYEQSFISNKEILLDTEGIEVETMKIENQNINYFTNKGVNQVYWNDNTYTYTLISSIDIEEIFKMTKSVLKNNNKNILN